MKTFHFAHNREKRKRDKTSVTGLVKQDFYFHTRSTVKTIDQIERDSSNLLTAGISATRFANDGSAASGNDASVSGKRKSEVIREIRTTGVTTRFQISTTSSAPREGRQV